MGREAGEYMCISAHLHCFFFCMSGRYLVISESILFCPHEGKRVLLTICCLNSVL